MVTMYIATAGGKLQEIQKRLSERYPKLRITVESDGVNALYSDRGDAAVICGTGSILMLKDGDGIAGSAAGAIGSVPPAVVTILGGRLCLPVRTVLQECLRSHLEAVYSKANKPAKKEKS